jgi:tetratricopeptide (TPR) repeat protein
MVILALELSKSERGLRSSFLALFLAAALYGDVAGIRELIRAGRLPEAIAACDRELQTAPSNAALLTLKGLALRASGDAPGALAALRAALKAAPSSMAALQAAAQLEFEARDPMAVRRLQAVVRADPANTTAHAMLSELAFEARDCAKALGHLAKTEKSPPVRWRTGVCLFELERWREAAIEFEALLKLREHGPTRYNLALSYWRAGDTAATVRALASLNDADAMSLRAAAHRARKEIPVALQTLQEAVAAFPDHEPLLLDLAMLCLDQNAVELGIAVLEGGVARFPKSARARTALGVFRARAGKSAEAESDFKAAAALSPESGMGQVAAAMAMIELGLAPEAAALLRKLPNGEPMVSLMLARALLQQTPPSLAEAKKLLLALTNNDPAARGLLGKVYAQEGNTAAAIGAFEAVLRITPDDRAAAYQLMALYKKAGRTADAARMSARVRELMAVEKAADAEKQRYSLSRVE